jgi:hypothetical protein
MSAIARRIARRFLAEEGPFGSAVETVMAGIALLIAQSVIVSNPFYDEKEIRKFLALRRGFHSAFADACAKLADGFEAGDFGPGAKPAAAPLRTVSKLTPTQDRQALVQVTRILRGLRQLGGDEVTPLAVRLIRQTMRLDAADAERSYGDDYTNYFKTVLKLEVVPAPLKSFIRKILQVGKGSDGKISLKPNEDENPGAWFDMPADEQEKVRRAISEAEGVYSKDFGGDSEAAQAAYRQSRDTLKRIHRQVGVNLDIVKRKEEAKESVEAALKREAKMDVDGATDFVLQKLIRRVVETSKQTRVKDPYREDLSKVPMPAEARKVVTLLKKAKTLETARKIVSEAIEKGTLSRYLLETVGELFDQTSKNKAVREGVPLVPLHWKPMTKEAFQEAHDTGDVELPSDMPEEDQAELLGRVSRAVSDLEGIFGKGFCGKHDKKLAFRFAGKDKTIMATAHYFAWDDKNVWQPRVTFGEDYEGVLAHELSHYFEDLIASRIDKKWLEDRGETKDPRFGSGGSIFGGGTAEYFAESWVEASYSGRGYRELKEYLPEAFELMAAVTNTPDYERWEDKISSAWETALPMAVKELTGMSLYDLPRDHPYAKVEKARYKSELPPELVEAGRKAYNRLMDGDERKLTYYQSAAEVWARMCEQYVYTKLSRAGIANPWLTWMSYDEDVYVDEARFEKVIEPIFDRLFAKLGTKNILARLVSAFTRARTSL